MKKKCLITLLAVFFIALPSLSKVHIRHTSPTKELTKEEKKQIEENNTTYLILGAIFFGALFYFGNKKK